MELAHIPSIVASHKISPVGTLGKAGPTFAILSPGSKWASFRVGPTNVGQQLKKPSWLSREKGMGMVPRCIQSSEGKTEDEPATQKFMRLYTAIKNRNLGELSDVLGEQFQLLSNFITVLPPSHLQWKQQAVNFFISLMGASVKGLNFVVHPNPDGGVDAGVMLQLGWRTAFAPFGQDFSFNSSHDYKGAFTIRNFHVFTESLHPTQLARVKWLGMLLSILHVISSLESKRNWTRAFAYSLVTVLLMTTLLVAIRRGFF